MQINRTSRTSFICFFRYVGNQRSTLTCMVLKVHATHTHNFCSEPVDISSIQRRDIPEGDGPSPKSTRDRKPRSPLSMKRSPCFTILRSGNFVHPPLVCPPSDEVGASKALIKVSVTPLDGFGIRSLQKQQTFRKNTNRVRLRVRFMLGFECCKCSTVSIK